MLKELLIQTDLTSNSIHINTDSKEIDMAFIHGFSGSHRSWGAVIDRIDRPLLAVDLPGHGNSSILCDRERYSIDLWAYEFNSIIDGLGIKELDICGYSMGGRLAIVFASLYPDRVRSLILESASYGIDDVIIREKRLQDDIDLSKRIARSISEFVDRWEAGPLFKGQLERNPSGFKEQRDLRLSQDPSQLALALSCFSQGRMRSYLDDILDFDFPVTIINGGEDHRYVKLGRDLSMCRMGGHYIIDGCGHNVHLESIDRFLEVLLKC